MNKSFSTKTVAAIGIGSALYFALSYLQIPIGPNVGLRPAVAILTIMGAFFGPMAGFFIGFIGHSLFDALTYGSVWWSWVFLSAVLGFSQGLINNDNKFSIKKGNVTKTHVVKMVIYSLIGMILAGVVAYVGDVFFYGEPADKVWLQIGIATFSNFIVVVILGIPSVLALSKMNKENTGLKN